MAGTRPAARLLGSASEAAGILVPPVLGVLTLIAACQPTTTRPTFTPFPEAAATEIRLDVPNATQRLAEALRADSIPVTKVELRDGYLETPWFEGATGRRVSGRALGPERVRVRGWADPSRPYFTQLSVETVYRPLADPSLPDRELERAVPKDHPVAVKVRAILDSLIKKYGGPPTAAPPTARTP